MICKNHMQYILLNKQRQRKGKPPLSRRSFCKLAATSSALLTMPYLFGCEESSENDRDAADLADAGKDFAEGQDRSYEEWDYEDDEDMTIAPQDIEYHSCTLGLDTRAEIKVDPNVELDDYSGPFRPNLRYTDFSRKHLATMYIMAHHYHYAIQRGYRDYIYDTWGNKAVCHSEEKIWGELMIDELHELYTDVMKIKGKDLEAFMKHWQLDINSLPGDHYDMVFEMPSEDRGLVTVNRCPVAEEYESRGRTDELHDVCMKKCPPAIANGAELYNPDIELKVLAMPPRQSEDHICCKFALHYKGDDFPETEEVDLKTDSNNGDRRGKSKVNSDVELEDYSGPFRPDLRFTDFSREQLARMFLMTHKHDLGMMIAYQEWAMERYGWKAMSKMPVVVWSEYLYDDAKKIITRFMNIKEKSIASYMKALQVDITAQPPNFDMKFEMPSEDRGIFAFNTCYAVTQMEPLGQNDKIVEFCAMDPPAIRRCGKLYHPDIRAKIMAIPPREHADEVCCKWDLYYQS